MTDDREFSDWDDDDAQEPEGLLGDDNNDDDDDEVVEEDLAAEHGDHDDDLNHVWLNEWRIASGEALRALISSASERVLRHEVAAGVRKRKRKPIDQQRFDDAMNCVICNLAYGVTTGEP